MKANIKLIEWFDEHWYKIVDTDENDNKIEHYYPSVTTKLGASPKPFLGRWRGDIGNREADLRVYEASEKGKRIHFACQLYLKGGIIIYNPYNRPNFSDAEIGELKNKGEVFILRDQDEMWQVYKFQKWIEAVKPEILGIEKILYSKNYREAGTADLILKIKEGDYIINTKKPIHLPAGLYLADIKSGGFYDEAYCQTAAYTKMYNEEAEEKITGTLILHLNSKIKTGIPGLSTHYHNQEEVEADFQKFRHIAQVWEDHNQNSMPVVFNFPAIISNQRRL